MAQKTASQKVSEKQAAQLVAKQTVKKGKEPAAAGKHLSADGSGGAVSGASSRAGAENPVTAPAAGPNGSAPSMNGPATRNGKGSGKTPQSKEKNKKPKLVRDSFTMPETEYQALGDMKKACIKAGFEVKKSELLRLGVMQIRNMNPGQLQEALAGLTPLKAGRPKKEK